MSQKEIDEFYAKHGPCCAGCDHWRWYNATAGDCLKSRIVPGNERAAMLGMHGVSCLKVGAGHAMTPRDHVCSLFEDTP